jgi:hypothetical protein
MWSKPSILSHQDILTGSTTPFLPLMHLKKETWPTFPQPSKSTFPSKMESSRKSPLAPLALLKKITAYKSLFQEYRDIFSWLYTEMPGLDPSIVEHRIDT